MIEPDPTAKAQADALENEMDQNRRMMADCPDCGKRPVLEYVPCVTHAKCCGQAFVEADWQPKAVREKWNAWAEKRKKERR